MKHFEISPAHWVPSTMQQKILTIVLESICPYFEIFLWVPLVRECVRPQALPVQLVLADPLVR